MRDMRLLFGLLNSVCVSPLSLPLELSFPAHLHPLPLGLLATSTLADKRVIKGKEGKMRMFIMIGSYSLAIVLFV